MSIVVEGKVWKFGDNISTDYLAPGYARSLGIGALACMRSNRPGWSEKVKTGDVIVAGKNFGCGSSRLSAPTNLQKLGIHCIVAESFGRIFFRNYISMGMLALACEGISEAFEEGQKLRANGKTGLITNLSTGQKLQARPLPELALKILEDGGVIQMLKKEYPIRNQ